MSAVIVPCIPVQLRRIAAGLFRYHADRFRYCRRPRTGRLGRSEDEGTNTATFTPRGICLMSRRRCSDRSPIESSLRPTPAPSTQCRSINPLTRNTLTGSASACTPGLDGTVSHPAPPEPVLPSSSAGDRIAATRCLPRTEDVRAVGTGRWASEQGRCAGLGDLHHQGVGLSPPAHHRLQTGRAIRYREVCRTVDRLLLLATNRVTRLTRTNPTLAPDYATYEVEQA